MNRIHRGGFGLVVVVGSLMAVPAFGQGDGASPTTGLSPLPAREDAQGGVRRAASAAPARSRRSSR